MNNVKETSRGFEYIEFSDRYGKECQLQQSSLAEFSQPGISAIWLGCEPNRMHLDRKQVLWLINKLILWLAEGSFREENQ